MQTTPLIIDSDMLGFRACAFTEVEIELSDDVWTRHSQLDDARRYYWDRIDIWCEEFETDRQQVIHCWTEKSAFRRELSPKYKLNRKGPKPIGFKAFKNEIMLEDNSFMFNRIEADDLIGIFATMTTWDTPPVVISGDKDLNQIPGRHAWIDKDNWYVSNDEAERFTYQQALQGDSIDGVPGCKGVGEIGAKKIVDGFDLTKPLDCWETVVSTYRTKGKEETPREAALLQARLTRILRHGEYSFHTHEVELWNPPTH